MLLTKYIDKFNPNKPLCEYPRPQFIRNSYISLNGNWDFTITKSYILPLNYDLNIVVPYCVESCLSGICQNVKENEFTSNQEKLQIHGNVEIKYTILKESGNPINLKHSLSLRLLNRFFPSSSYPMVI